eukprot:3713136-Prorocentrum_lima.AAC.1
MYAGSGTGLRWTILQSHDPGRRNRSLGQGIVWDHSWTPRGCLAHVVGVIRAQTSGNQIPMDHTLSM